MILASEPIPLVNGPALPAEVLALALDLEREGFIFYARDGVFRLACQNGEAVMDRLSETNKDAIVKWKQHLLALCDYISSDTAERNSGAQPRSQRNQRNRAQPKTVSD